MKRVLLWVLIGFVVLFGGCMVLGVILFSGGSAPPSSNTVEGDTAESELVELRTNPAPLGATVSHSGLEIRVVRTLRHITLIGEHRIHEPRDGYEWISIELSIHNPGDPNETQTLSAIDFRIVSADGSIYDEAHYFTSDIAFEPIPGEIFGQSEVKGKVYQQVRQGESGLVLIYSPKFQGSRYFALEKEK